MTCQQCTDLEALVREADENSDGPGLIVAQRLLDDHEWVDRINRRTDRLRQESAQLQESIDEMEAEIVRIAADSRLRFITETSVDWLPMGACEPVWVQAVCYRYWRNLGTWPDMFQLAEAVADTYRCRADVAGQGVLDAGTGPGRLIEPMHTVVAETHKEAFGPFGSGDYFRMFVRESFWAELEPGYRRSELINERVRFLQAGIA